MDGTGSVWSGELGLLERARRGDPRAFEQIVREHQREIYGVARRILGSHEDADDATQETFVRAWRALGAFRGEAALRTWLYRIALNVARSMAARRPDGEGLDGLGEQRDPAASSETRLGARELRERIGRAVAALPPRQREVVMLKVFAEMSYEEVARVLEITTGAVKAHLHQAVANLRRRVG